MKTQNQKGFTLVEIAIVLVIIGLLLGGVLKGQELIKNAKIKNINNDAQGIIAAMFSYQDRYGVLPGDDDSSTIAAATDGDTTNNNGNGQLEDNESDEFFIHLREAGLLKGEGGTLPSHAFGGDIELDENAYTNAQGNNLCFVDLPGDVADIVDRQNDDGNPSKGSIQSSSTQTAYTTDGSVTYDLCYKL